MRPIRAIRCRVTMAFALPCDSPLLPANSNHKNFLETTRFYPGTATRATGSWVVVVVVVAGVVG